MPLSCLCILTCLFFNIAIFAAEYPINTLQRSIDALSTLQHVCTITSEPKNALELLNPTEQKGWEQVCASIQESDLEKLNQKLNKKQWCDKIYFCIKDMQHGKKTNVNHLMTLLEFAIEQKAKSEIITAITRKFSQLTGTTYTISCKVIIPNHPDTFDIEHHRNKPIFKAIDCLNLEAYNALLEFYPHKTEIKEYIEKKQRCAIKEEDKELYQQMLEPLENKCSIQ